MAVTNPICKGSLPIFMVMGPNTATVAELDNTLAITVVMMVTIRSPRKGKAFRIGPTKLTTEPASHSAAPVALIFAPKEMVDPKVK